MAGFTTEAKVGVFILVGLFILAYMTLQVGQFRVGREGGYEIWAEFEDVTGLKPDTPVQVAGIQIGTVEAIELSGAKARVKMRIHSDVQLPADSGVWLRTMGVLGDKYVAIVPGNQAAPKLKEGDKVTKVGEGTDLDKVIQSIGPIAEDLKAITAALRASLATPDSQRNISEALANIRELTGALKVVIADNQKNLNRIISNLESFTGDLSAISGQNREAINEIIRNFRSSSGQLERTMVALADVLGKVNEGKGTVGALVNERDTIESLNSTLASLREITAKIERGEGTLGRLVNDESTADSIENALNGISDFLGETKAWQIFVTYRGDYLFSHDYLRSELNFRLQPKADKFYLVGVVDDPQGRRYETTTDTTYTVGGQTWTVSEDEVRYGRSELKWNLQIGKRYRDLAVRAGIFSSTGGFGLDYYLMEDTLKASFEAFDFHKGDRPHLRALLDFTFFKHFYLTAGMDDFASDEDRSSFFLGAGISFHDEDIKLLLTNVPKP